jgi:hypothetical protein
VRRRPRIEPSGSPPGERLANIAARNARPPWYANKAIRAVIIAVMVILCLVLVAVTDYGKPKVEPRKPATHVDGIYLRK